MNIWEMNIDEFRNNMARGIFGMSIKEALDKGICLNCNDPALDKCYSEAGKKEYHISGVCEECFDKVFS